MSEETKDIILEKVITIEEVTSKDFSGSTKYSIKADGKTFGLWKLKKDNTETKAFQFFKTLGMEANGEMVQISYKEVPGSYKDKTTGENKETTYYNIIMMKRPSAADALMAQPMEREEQTYQKEGSLESQISKLEMRVLALECKDTPEAPENPSKVANIASEEVNSGSPDTTYKGKDGEDIVIPF